MVEENYFYDSYALIEILFGNSNYEQYKINKGFIITKLNLRELYYYILRNLDEKTAEKIYEEYLQYTIEITDNDIKEACKFKLQHKKQNLSYTDCIGYITAKNKNMQFLTGDKEFEKMPNVKFVK